MLRIIKKEIVSFCLLTIFLVSLLFSCRQTLNKIAIENPQKDSISFYIKEYKNLNVNHVEQSKYLIRAKLLNDLILNDSLKKANCLKMAFEAYKNSDDLLFKKINNEALKLSLKLKDTSGIAEANWHYGLFYGKKEILDSSYYHYFQAYKYYNVINHKNYTAKMLYNMAFIQSRLKDFTGSESKLFQAISIYKPLNKNLSLYKCYNLLGSIYQELGDYNTSLSYHNMALGFLNKVKNSKTYKQRSLNDLALIYRLQGEYDKSIEALSQALNSDSLYFKDTKLYAKLLDNHAYSKLLNRDILNLNNDFNSALKIRDSLKDYSGIVISKIHLSEYYFITKDTINSVLLAKEANVLAKEINNNRDILTSLLLLSKTDVANASKHLNAYVNLKEKLEKQERTIKNKFARIRFETDEHIERAEKLSLQKTILCISVIGLVLVFVLIYFLRVQKAKTKELLLETRQQQANEEIYGLMLEQQSKLEEGRLKERFRISEELHDGVLGKIFGARMGLGFLEIEGEEKELDKHEQYINDLQKIEEEIRDISHELKNEILSSSNSFISLVESLVKEKSQIGDFNYLLTKVESSFWNESSDIIKINTYRIIQEALQNILKYAKAKNVSLQFNYFNGNFNLLIKDDGVGFDVKRKRNGIGLTNMESRIETLKGNITIISYPGKGTEIKIEIPNTI